MVPDGLFGSKATLHMTTEQHTYGEARGRQCHALLWRDLKKMR